MKKRSSHHRARTFNAPVLRLPAEDRSANPFRFLSLGRRLGTGTKRFFIIKQAVQLPPTSSAGSRTVQHVLIFDDHPESLRLVFGGAAAQVDLSRLPGASSRHLVLLSIRDHGLADRYFVVVLLTIPRLSGVDWHNRRASSEKRRASLTSNVAPENPTDVQ